MCMYALLIVDPYARVGTSDDVGRWFWRMPSMSVAA